MTDGLMLSNVTRRFPGQRDGDEALRDVHLSVAPGQFLTVLGPSGCGKSTLLRLIAGLDQLDRGLITLCGGSPSDARRAKAIGFVSQRPALLPWLSVHDNVTLPQRVNRRADRKRAEPWPDTARILANVDLADVAHRKPHELSGGMQQRVAVARAFALQPRVLLLDEPFAALDELTRAALQDQLLQLWRRRRPMVVFVTHSIREAALLSDVVAVMAGHPGRIRTLVPIELDRPRDDSVLRSAELRDHEELLRAALFEAWTVRA
jgi:NitT/TauT family transport system ATP-binding protein